MTSELRAEEVKLGFDCAGRINTNTVSQYMEGKIPYRILIGNLDSAIRG